MAFVFTSTDLKSFLLTHSNETRFILRDAERKGMKISDAQLARIQKKLVKHYMTKISPSPILKPAKIDIELIAQAICDTFPGTTTVSKQIYETTRENNKKDLNGSLYYRFKRFIEKEKKFIESPAALEAVSSVASNMSVSSVGSSVMDDSRAEERVEDALTLLESTTCNDVEILKEALTTTFNKRMSLIHGTDEEHEKAVLSCFSRFPILVSKDFELQFPEAACNGLLANWDTIAPKIEKIFSNTGKKIVGIKYEDLKIFAKLLKLLPCANKYGGFDLCWNSLFNFLDSNTLNLEEIKYQSSNQPSINIIIQNEKIVQFVVAYDKNLIIFPPGTTLLQCIDFTCKLYHILDYQHPASLKKFYTFFDFYFYKIVKKCTGDVKSLCDLIEIN